MEADRGLSPRKAFPMAWMVLLMYIGFVALRLWGIFYMIYGIDIQMDEQLHVGLIHSLWNHGKILFRGQPIDYNSILYHLLLAPLTALPKGVDPYQAIQVANVFLMSLAVFPAYSLAKRITGCDKKALVVGFFTLLAPDVNMTRFAMAENILYPLVMLSFLSVVRASKESGWKAPWTMLSGVLMVLIYYAKPGYVAIGAVWALYLVVEALVKRDVIHLRRCVLGLGAMAVSYLLASGFVASLQTVNESLEVGLYSGQLLDWAKLDWKVILTGCMAYAFGYGASYLLFPVLVPASISKGWAPEAKMLRILTFGGLGMMIAGTAYAVYLPETAPVLLESRIHLRYLQSFLPPLLMLTLAPNVEGQRANWKLIVLSLAMVLGAVFLLPHILVLTHTVIPATFTLAFYLNKQWMELSRLPFKILVIALGILLPILGLWLGYRKKIIKAFLCGLTCMMILCNITFFRYYASTEFSQNVRADAEQVLDIAAGRKMLYMANSHTTGFGSVRFLESVSKEGLPINIVSHTPKLLVDEDGPIRFVPEPSWKERPEYPIQAEVLVFDQISLKQVMFSESIQVQAMDNGELFIVEPPAGEFWFKARIGGAIGKMLMFGSYLEIIDPELLAAPSIQLEFTVGALGTEGIRLDMVSGEERYTFENLQEGDVLTASFTTLVQDDTMFIRFEPFGLPTFSEWQLSVGAE